MKQSEPQTPQTQKSLRNAYYFDFDCTLTKSHVGDYQTYTSEYCKNILKDGAIDTLRDLIEKKHYVAIITYGTARRVNEVLKGAGFTQYEMSTIHVYGVGGDLIIYGLKSNEILELSKGKWQDAQNHFFYDDREDFCEEVRKIIPKFKELGKSLEVIKVTAEDNYFLSKIREEALAYTPVPEVEEQTDAVNTYTVVSGVEEETNTVNTRTVNLTESSFKRGLMFFSCGFSGGAAAGCVLEYIFWPVFSSSFSNNASAQIAIGVTGAVMAGLASGGTALAISKSDCCASEETIEERTALVN